MPRSIWNGAITFGLVTVPISVHSATQSETIHFHEVHVEDGAPIEHRRVCPADGEVVPFEHVVKGFEVRKGEYVEVGDEELKAAAGTRSKRVEVEHFVDGADIDPVFYERSYHLGARKGGERAYRLLHDALARTGRAAIARWVFHDRERLVAIRCLDEALAMHTMRFHDELVPAGQLELPEVRRKPSEREKEMAVSLIEGLHEGFDPARYEDTYRDAVMKVIEAKAAGKPVTPPEAEDAGETPDLLAALQASLDGAGKQRAERHARPRSSRRRTKAAR